MRRIEGTAKQDRPDNGLSNSVSLVDSKHTLITKCTFCLR